MKRASHTRRVACLCLGLCCLAFPFAHAALLDLRNAVVVAPAGLSPVEQRAARMLVEEIEKRTGVRWPIQSAWPSQPSPVVALGPVRLRATVTGPFAETSAAGESPTAPEGFHLSVKSRESQPAVLLLGHDPRGVLFGVGRLLRELRLGPGRIALDDALNLVSSPKTRLRGHQLGYRPKTHSYDAWDLPVWEQYFRDLVIFGCNAIELIPPRSDDDADSPHYPRPPLEMMIAMSRLADDYDLDVWVWFPAMDADYSQPATVDASLREWTSVLSRLPRLDVVFVPGGDPGHTQPTHLMALLKRQTAELRTHHPKAQMWVSPQGFTGAWMDEFVDILHNESLDWLGGLVYGPQVRVPLSQLRAVTPARYPIRLYPDITHTRQCQYPVPEWDTAFAITEARECINPRPLDEAVIFQATIRDSIGFITYSEGCNDDVNKAVWSALGWDPATPIDTILRDYSRVFIGDHLAEAFSQGLLQLEQNWRGPLATNLSVEATLRWFQSMETNCLPRDLRNWRFQQAVFRAYYDAYTRRRLLFESDLESRALEHLRTVSSGGSLEAMNSAACILARADVEPVAPTLRQRIFELGEALFQSISMQLSVSKHRAIAVDRGACLDTLDYPLNNRPWLLEQFARIRLLSTEEERLQALQTIVNWENPGPGGFYDDLGSVARQPHLAGLQPLASDPGRFHSPRIGFEEDLVVDSPEERNAGARRRSWLDHAETLYDQPLFLHYRDLDSQARYRVRVVYGGDNPKRKIALSFSHPDRREPVEIHPLMLRPVPFKPLEFDLPPEANANGQLTLLWNGERGLGGNGRGCQVSEVWLIKHP